MPTDLPSQWVTPSVPRNAPVPDPEWLTIRIAALLSHYFQPDESNDEYRMRMADWRDALAGLPQQAIEMAVRDRIGSDCRARPVPGEIKAAAKAHIKRPTAPPELRVVEHTPPTAEEKARAGQMMRDHGFGHLCKMPPMGPVAIIMQATADVTGVSMVDLRSMRRGGSHRARMAAAWLARKHTGQTYPAMAKTFNRDHSSVMGSVNKAEGLMQCDPAFAEMVAEIERRLAK